MSQYVITCSKKLLKTTARQEIDNISVPTGYALCFYDGKNVVLKDNSSKYTYIDNSDVTKFEVYATNAVIHAGTVDTDTGLAYAVDVSAGMSHTFKLRSDTPQADQDVIIDWGDGTSSNLKNGNFDSLDDSEYDENGELIYLVSHTYTTPGKYIVTITGKNYWGMQTLNSGSILSRIFAADLPIASCIKNLSLSAQYSPKLQSVMIPTGMDFFVNIHNASGIFQSCVNLLSVTNMATKFQYTRYVQNMFNGCSAMTTCDFRIPQNCIKANAYRYVFKNCAALVANVADLLPERGFDGVNLDFNQVFYGCASLTGTVPASILWEDMRVVWQNTSQVFSGCSAAILAQVPTSWGGTATDVEDPHPITRSQAGPIIESKIAEAIQDLPISSGGNSGVGNILGGYAAKILSYEEVNGVYNLYLEPDLNNEVDWSKFTAGQTIRISLIDSNGDDENYISAEIATVDSANNKLTLASSIYGTKITSSTTIGMDKKTVSGYVANATGGPSVYRVTYNGAGTDDELYEGRTIYTRAGSGAFVSNSILGTSGNYIYLSSAASGTTSIYLAPSTAFVLVAELDSENTISASGEYNLVVGEASSASGAFNVVNGMLTEVSGSGNTVIGDNSYVAGNNNTANGTSVNIIGMSNVVNDGLCTIFGDQNKIYKQGAMIFGDMNTAVAVNTNALGDNNTLKAYGVTAVGTMNKLSGKYSVAVGYHNTVSAETAYVVGRYADVKDYAYNKNAFIVWGGENQNNSEAFSVRVFREELNSAFDGTSLWAGYNGTEPNPKDSKGELKYNSVPGYCAEYKGQMKPKTKTIEVSGTQAENIDPTLFGRVVLTGNGSISLTIEDSLFEDGDTVQIVLNSSNTTLNYPANWIVSSSFDNILGSGGIHMIQVIKTIVGSNSAIFAQII